jgi:hypothetical protein
MADKATEARNTEKSLVNKDGSVTELIEWATESALTPEQMLDKFLEAGVAVSHGEELTGDYTVIHGDEKQAFLRRMLGERAFVVQWHFYEGDTGEFAAMHIVFNVGKYILNDSAKSGMYGQLRAITDKREAADPKAASTRTSTAGLMVARGIREKTPFYYYYNADDKADPRNNKAIKKADLAETPEKYRKLSNPVFQFDL